MEKFPHYWSFVRGSTSHLWIPPTNGHKGFDVSFDMSLNKLSYIFLFLSSSVSALFLPIQSLSLSLSLSISLSRSRSLSLSRVSLFIHHHYIFLGPLIIRKIKLNDYKNKQEAPSKTFPDLHDDPNTPSILPIIYSIVCEISGKFIRNPWYISCKVDNSHTLPLQKSEAKMHSDGDLNHPT